MGTVIPDARWCQFFRPSACMAAKTVIRKALITHVAGLAGSPGMSQTVRHARSLQISPAKQSPWWWQALQVSVRLREGGRQAVAFPSSMVLGKAGLSEKAIQEGSRPPAGTVVSGSGACLRCR